MTRDEVRIEVMSRLREIGPRPVSVSVVAHWCGDRLSTAATWQALLDLWEAEFVEQTGEQTFRLIVRAPAQLRLGGEA